MQTICTSLQTDNHTNNPSLNFYRPDALVNVQQTVSKHWILNIKGLVTSKNYCQHSNNKEENVIWNRNFPWMVWNDTYSKQASLLTRGLIRGPRPMRSSVQTVSRQTRGDRPTPTHWSNPTRSYCCGSSTPALCQSSAWSPATWNE